MKIDDIKETKSIQEVESELITKFGSTEPNARAICKVCGIVQAKHFGAVCPTKERLKYIRTPEEELECQRAYCCPTPIKKFPPPLPLKAFMYLLFRALPFVTIQELVQEAKESNYALFDNKSLQEISDSFLERLSED